MSKWKAIVDFLMNILGTIWFRRQLPVLSPKNWSKPEVDQNDRKYAQTKVKNWLSNELIRSHTVPTSTFGFIAEKPTVNRIFINIVVNVFTVIFWFYRRKRDPDNPLVNLLPRAKREDKRVLVNLPPRAKREAEEILVNLYPRTKRETKGVLVNLPPLAKREAKRFLVN